MEMPTVAEMMATLSEPAPLDSYKNSGAEIDITTNTMILMDLIDLFKLLLERDTADSEDTSNIYDPFHEPSGDNYGGGGDAEDAILMDNPLQS